MDKKIFDNKNYPTIMFFLITIMSLLVFFNFTGIVIKNEIPLEKNTITFSAVFDEPIEKININKSKIIFYSFAGILISLIFMIAFVLESLIKENRK